MPAKVSQQVLMILDRNWISFKESNLAYKESPSKFKGRPALLGYKHKIKGRNVVVYTAQAIRKNSLSEVLLIPVRRKFTSKPR